MLAMIFANLQCAASAQKSDASTGEYEAQSQYLRSFVEFVNWPARPPNFGARSTINFCVLGDDPYGKLLDDMILGHSFGNKQGMIMRGRHLEDLGVCDVLFIGRSEDEQEEKILHKMSKKSVLTIGDTDKFAERGGIIEFVWRQGHLGFLINVDAADRAGLKISASLLALAQIVHDPAAKRSP